ncbi:MAG: GH3 auxin-responsive promoter family protein, partial [Blautia sp.]|nr:GH3 auxin-responsive promoter family protein [Blautia sp.]
MDTGRYEAESRKHLREKAEMAEQEQESFLFDVLRRQSDTVYGREHDFASLRSLEVFQDTLPFTEFSDMEPYMQREVAGERGVLLSEKPYFFCISSGSTGAPKYLPIGREDAALQHLYLDGAIPAMIEEKISPGRRCRFATTDVFRTFMEDGTLSGVRSGMSANLALEEGRFPFLEYYAPREVLFPGTLSDMSYVKLRFALDRG